MAVSAAIGVLCCGAFAALPRPLRRLGLDERRHLLRGPCRAVIVVHVPGYQSVPVRLL